MSPAGILWVSDDAVARRPVVTQPQRGTRSVVDSVFVGTSEMAQLMKTIDWAQTPLGAVEDWPNSLRTALGILLASGYPMYIAWGPEYV